MTDSKTPEWAAAVDRAIGRLQGLDDYAGRPAWESILREELDVTISQALAAVDQRAYARGIEDAANHLAGLAKGTPLGHESVQRGRSTYNWLTYCATAIRQLLEGK